MEWRDSESCCRAPERGLALLYIHFQGQSRRLLDSLPPLGSIDKQRAGTIK